MPSLGPMEILVILVVALIVLGPTRLPEAGRQVGKAMSEFRRWSTGVQSELRSALDDVTPPTIGPTQQPLPSANGDQTAAHQPVADPPSDKPTT